MLVNVVCCWEQRLKLVANLLAVPQYVTASSPEGLRANMLKVQLKYSVQYTWFNIIFANGKWYAWYFHEPKSDAEQLKAAKLAATKE